MDENTAAYGRPSTPPRLIVERGPISPSELLINQPEIRVGRSSANDLVINDPEISRLHARIVAYGEGYAAEDLGSTNGTFVNGVPARGVTPLSHGDRIEFGDTSAIRFWLAEEEAAIPEPEWDEAPPPPPPVAQPEAALTPPPAAAPAWSQRRLLLGCLALLTVGCLCGVATLFVLDAYDQGRLLYCGGLQPFWELILGPFGFNPLCP